MKLILLGANGRTGALVLRRALDKGDDVTAIARAKEKLPGFYHERLHAVVGDPCDTGFLTEVLPGHDAVISTLGGRLPTRRATSIYHRSAEAITGAALATGVRRIAVTSTALLFPPQRFTDRLLAAAVFNVVRSAGRMERQLCASGLDVSIARCGFLNDSDEMRYRARKDALPPDGTSVSRRSLAFYLVDDVHGAWSGCHVFGVSGPALAG